jgi:dinuclear metal center YbgI/SA1388 family protein
MSTVSEIYRHLSAVLPTSLSCDWDNDGLMVCASPDKEVKKILLALDVTPAVAEYAAQIGADLIISHHPLIFSGIRHMDGRDGTSRKVISLLHNHIAVMSFHTRLDAADGGVNDILASLFSLSDIEKFGVDGDTAARIGTLPKSMAFEDFCRLAKDTLGAPCVCGAKGGETVSRLAVLGGSGKDYIREAQKMGADAYLTGEVNYNYLLEAAENGLSVVTAGHYHTEAPALVFFERTLTEAFGPLEFVRFPDGCEFFYC